VTDESGLPTLGDKLSEWLGFQLPTFPIPQTIRNIDKAAGRIVGAMGENAEARIKANTNIAKANGKINVEGLYRTAEEKRKIENRADVLKHAIDDLNSDNAAGRNTDAQSEIDDDWLNMFARLAEDKSSDELKGLFGKILAGEIRRPGAFSLRTIQFVSVLSKEDANEISKYFSFAVGLQDFFIVPFLRLTPHVPVDSARIFMNELGIASSPNSEGGLAWYTDIHPSGTAELRGTGTAVALRNNSTREIHVEFGCQVLTRPGQELMQIANAPPSPLEYMKGLAHHLYETLRENYQNDLMTGSIIVHVGTVSEAKDGSVAFREIYRVEPE
jgi:hypothetical protein